MVESKAIVRGTLARFLPTSAFLMGVGLVPLILSRTPGLSVRAPILAALEVAGATIGYGAALWVMRKRLSSDAPVSGRQSIVAGVVGPVVIMFAFMVIGSPHTLMSLSVGSLAAGAALGLTMFFPWLARPAAPLVVSTDVIGRSVDPVLPSGPFVASTKTFARAHLPVDEATEGE